MWTLASVPSVFPKAVHIPVSSLDREQHASLECPLKRVVSKIPYGYLYRQQAAYTTEEAAVCSHCTLGPHGEKSTVGLTGCNGVRARIAAQACLTLCDSMDSNPSSVHGILQARILEWVAISSPWGSS